MKSAPRYEHPIKSVTEVDESDAPIKRRLRILGKPWQGIIEKVKALPVDRVLRVEMNTYSEYTRFKNGLYKAARKMEVRISTARSGRFLYVSRID